MPAHFTDVPAQRTVATELYVAFNVARRVYKPKLGPVIHGIKTISFSRGVWSTTKHKYTISADSPKAAVKHHLHIERVRSGRFKKSAIIPWGYTSRGVKLIVGARWPDQSLHGIRVFTVMFGGKLMSPQAKLVWDRQALTAPELSPANSVRAHAGIHAAWPALYHKVPPELRSYIDLQSVIAHVAGYGECVVGDVGWRAERCMIIEVHTHCPEIAKAVKQHYPDVITKVEDYVKEYVNAR